MEIKKNNLLDSPFKKNASSSLIIAVYSPPEIAWAESNNSKKGNNSKYTSKSPTPPFTNKGRINVNS